MTGLGMGLGIIANRRGGGAGGGLAPATPDYYRVALLAEATGQSDGTGYTTEESTHGQALTYNGDAQVTSGKFEFDGTGDSIQLPNTFLWTPTTKFTIEVFGLVFDAVNTGTPQGVLSHYSALLGGAGWIISESGGALTFGWSTTGSATTNTITIAPTVTAGTEYNVAICWDGATVYAFVNGSEAADSEAFSGTFYTANAELRMGAYGNGAGNPSAFLDGRIECALMTRGEVLYEQGNTYSVPSLPRALNTTPTDTHWPDVVLLLSYDEALGKIVDQGPLDLPMTIAGNVAGSTAVEPYADANSVAFDGSGDYIQIADDPLLEFGSGDFTVEASVRLSDVRSNRTILAKYNATASKRAYWFMWWFDGTPDSLLSVLSSNGTSTTLAAGGSFTPTVDTFYHFADCRSGSSHRKFVDGTLSGSATTFSGALHDNDAPLRIGATSNGVDLMNGYISELRVTKAARYTTSFTAPSSRFPRG